MPREGWGPERIVAKRMLMPREERELMPGEG